MKKIYIVVLALVVAVAVIAPAIAGIGSEERDCYGSELAPGVPVFLCMYASTMAMDKSFFEYEVMHEYYTPQLKEIVVTVGSTETFTPKKIGMGSLTVTGSPSYLYVKHV